MHRIKLLILIFISSFAWAGAWASRPETHWADCAALLAPGLELRLTRRTYHIPDGSMAWLESQAAPNPRSPEVQYRNSVASLANAASAKFRGWTQVKTVFYPFSGTDAALGFKLFRAATTVIAADGVGFMPTSPADGTLLEPTYRPQTRFQYHQNVRNGGPISSRLLGELKSQIPGLRILRVEGLSFEGQEHGLIEFDGGPGSEVRQYIHLNLALAATDSTPEKPLWHRFLKTASIDAVVIKAAMGQVVAPSSYPRLYREERLLRKTISEILTNRNGFLVEGQTPDGLRWEFTAPEHADLDTSRPYEVLHVEGLAFGYGHTARVERFLK